MESNKSKFGYDVRKDLRYLQGVEDVKRKIIPRLLKYDVLSVEYIAKITKVNVKYVLDIQNDMKMKKG
jgi:hypothetical protein